MECSRSSRRVIIAICRVAGWSLAGLITIISLVPPNFRPETPLPHNIEHFAIFAAAGAAFGFGYSDKRKLAMVSLLAFAAGIEVAQKMVPGRHARMSDFIVDAISLLIAQGVGVALSALIAR